MLKGADVVVAMELACVVLAFTLIACLMVRDSDRMIREACRREVLEAARRDRREEDVAYSEFADGFWTANHDLVDLIEAWSPPARRVVVEHPAKVFTLGVAL